MRTQFMCLALAIVLLCPFASAQWAQTNGPNGGSVECLAMSDTILFAGTDHGIFRSTNNGTNWTTASNGVPTQSEAQTFVVNGTNLIAGTNYDGVFFSTNNGSSWTAVNTGLTDTSVNVLAIFGSHLFAGTYRGGVWRRPLSEMIPPSGVVTSVALPSAFELEQNYPNPFNPGTTIRYGLLNRSYVTLAVYNTLGQQVTLLQNGEQEAGYHEVKFDGSGLSSGVYFCRMQAGTFVETRKLVQLK